MWLIANTNVNVLVLTSKMLTLEDNGGRVNVDSLFNFVTFW